MVFLQTDVPIVHQDKPRDIAQPVTKNDRWKESRFVYHRKHEAENVGDGVLEIFGHLNRKRFPLGSLTSEEPSKREGRVRMLDRKNDPHARIVFKYV